MPKALKIARSTERASKTVLLRRDGKPDLQFEGLLLLGVETQPVSFDPNKGGWRPNANPQHDEKIRWKKYALYRTVDSAKQFIVSEEGHSTVKSEVTRYHATICRTAADAWVAMGKIEELKAEFEAIGYPAIEKFGYSKEGDHD